MAKTRKDFFTPARQEGWYRAQPTEAARSAVDAANAQAPDGRPDVYYIAGETRHGLGRTYAAPDHYNLMHQLARDSEGVRAELGAALAGHIAGLDGNGQVREWMKNISQINSAIYMLTPDEEIDDLDIDDLDHLGWEPPEPQPKSMAEYHAELDEAANRGMLELRRYNAANPADDPKSDFRRRLDHGSIYQLETATKRARILADMAVNAELLGADKAAEAAGKQFTDQLTPDQLVRSHDDLIVHLRGNGNWFNDFAKQVRGPHIGALSLATRHWGEINADGRYGGGISVNNGRDRILAAETVRQIGVRMTEQADIDAAITRPKAAQTGPDASGPSAKRIL